MQTSSNDYTIIGDWKCDDIIYNTHRAVVTIATWRYQKVCVKEIATGDDGKMENELCILSKCIHPRICQFLGAKVTPDRTYMIFEYMHNRDLSYYMSSVVLSPHDRRRIMLDIATGLHYLHNRHPEIIVHRDLKPENILINKHGEAKIGDFGISKLVSTLECKTFEGHTGEAGTYVWMSPEVLKHEVYNYKTDMYSLGLLIYYVWTGKRPFYQLHMNTIQLAFAKLNGTAHLEDITHDQIQHIVHNCILDDPNERFDTEEVIHALQSLSV